MGNSKSKPTQASTNEVYSSGDLHGVPIDVVFLILWNLDIFTFYKTFPEVCKQFKKFHSENFHSYHVYLKESQMRGPMSVLQELSKNIKRFCIAEASKKIDANQSPTKIFPPRRILNWSNGNLIPGECYVFVFANDVHKDQYLTKIHSIIILPKSFPNSPYLEGIKLILYQELKALKRVGLCNISLDKTSLESIGSLELDILCWDDCQICSYDANGPVEPKLPPFNAKILYLEITKSFGFSDPYPCSNLEELIIYYLKLDEDMDRGTSLNMNFSESSLLKIV